MERYTALAMGKSFDVSIDRQTGELRLGDQDPPLQVRGESRGELTRLRIDGKSLMVYCRPVGENEYEIWIHHQVITVQLEDERSRLLRAFSKNTSLRTGTFLVKAPMPGLVIGLSVAPGDRIEAGQGIVVLEAMKMENEIRSTVQGTVKSLHVERGAAVEKNQLLVTIEEL